MTILNFYHIPSEIPKNVCDEIIKQYDNELDYEPGIVGDRKLDHKKRKSKVVWVYSDSWISGMLSHFINCANENHFNLELSRWYEKIQFTVYNAKHDHYNWHIDVSQDDLKNNFVRKLSIVMCLSSKDDYEGGEFEIYYPHGLKETKKLDYGDVVVFPSIIPHKVRPIKSGKRYSLVGWYGGPPFK
jgi:PKHD-type hydroxylase